MSAELIAIEPARASNYVKRALEGFLTDPADTDYQRGYLAALLVLYREGLGMGIGDDRLALLEAQVSR